MCGNRADDPAYLSMQEAEVSAPLNRDGVEEGAWAGIPEGIGGAWIRERLAEQRVEDERRASEVRSDGARRLLDASRVVVVADSSITVVDGDILDFIQDIETPVIANCPECDAPIGDGVPGCVHWPSSEAGSLDAAWAEAEAALPEGWWFRVTRAKSGAVSAVAADPTNRWDWKGTGPTPTAALRALAAKLREKP